MAGEVLSDAAFPPDHQVRPLVRNGRGELFTGRQSSRRIGYVAGLYRATRTVGPPTGTEPSR